MSTGNGVRGVVTASSQVHKLHDAMVTAQIPHNAQAPVVAMVNLMNVRAVRDVRSSLRDLQAVPLFFCNSRIEDVEILADGDGAALPNTAFAHNLRLPREWFKQGDTVYFNARGIGLSANGHLGLVPNKDMQLEFVCAKKDVYSGGGVPNVAATIVHRT